jgi:hypothetical protein
MLALDAANRLLLRIWESPKQKRRGGSRVGDDGEALRISDDLAARGFKAVTSAVANQAGSA